MNGSSGFQNGILKFLFIKDLTRNPETKKTLVQYNGPRASVQNMAWVSLMTSY